LTVVHLSIQFNELGYGDSINMVEPEQLPEITDALLGLGYSDDDVRLILGENHLRIAEQVWC
jgi:microsomal dipeptidase-like Zn-dependent dipeptidase